MVLFRSTASVQRCVNQRKGSLPTGLLRWRGGALSYAAPTELITSSLSPRTTRSEYSRGQLPPPSILFVLHRDWIEKLTAAKTKFNTTGVGIVSVNLISVEAIKVWYSVPE